MDVLRTARLELVPLTLPMVEAVMLGRKAEAESVAGARLPQRWPDEQLVARAFTVSLDAIRADPAARLWGSRVMVAGGDGPARRVVGSVVFSGRPGADGVAEMGYGVEDASQGQGYATEAVRACLDWALSQEGVRAVHAATFPWHRRSLRIIEKMGMVQVGTREHETMGEIVVYGAGRG
jgi:RimJ/RimL family protein N-acetyltransferase